MEQYYIMSIDKIAIYTNIESGAEKVKFDSGKIKEFKGKSLVDSSPDLIAVKYGIKKVTRINCNNLNEFEELKKGLEWNSLKVVCSDEKLFGKINMYISKFEHLAEKAKEIDPSFKIIKHNKNVNDMLDDIYQFSELLNYPHCCIKKYIENVSKNVKVGKDSLKMPVKINFLFNNILNGVSNHYLSFHFPCSFDCKKTLDYQRRIFNTIEEVSPHFAKEIKQYLQNPYLIFLNPSLDNMFISWDNRKGFIFDGFVKGKSLFYSGVIYFKTIYPDCKTDETNREFRLLIEKIKEGNKIIFEEKNFQIYKDKIFLHEFENKENMQPFLFNFV